ncbi:hypothetical protein Pfo_021173 [Paulownia fortunei]|nr:hypothetical protein Pfo_021173 [Paulownia fortunei]
MAFLNLGKKIRKEKLFYFLHRRTLEILFEGPNCPSTETKHTKSHNPCADELRSLRRLIEHSEGLML